MFSLDLLPTWISWWLGYRSPTAVRKPLPRWRVWFWSFIAAFLGIAILEVVFIYGEGFLKFDATAIVPSFGASAVLLYGAIDSPLAQPRNAFCGHVIGAVVGVIINVLFVQLPHFASQEQQIAVRWVGGATAMALTLVLSQMGNVVHPPAGATALIAVVSDSSVQEGWFYIAHVIICICLQLGVALLVNNIEKRYPVYWWTPSVPAPPSTPSQKEVLSVIEEGRNSDIINLKNLDYNEGGILLLPGQPIIYPSNIILDPEEQEILNRIHAKIDAHASQ